MSKGVLEISGVFFLPNSKKSQPGSLVINEKTKLIELTIYGNHALDGTELSHLMISDYAHYHPIVLGRTSFGLLSLIHSQWKKTQPVGHKIKKIVYRSETMLRKIHISDLNQFHVSSIKCKFRWVDSWIDGLDSSAKVEHVAEGNTTTKIIYLDDNTALQFIDNLWISPAIMTRTIEKKFAKHIKFEYKSPVIYSKALENIRRLKKLIDFSLQRSNGIRLLNCQIPKKEALKHEDRHNTSDILSINMSNFSIEEDDFEEDTFIHQNKMIFSKWKQSETELERIIKIWYTQKDLDHIHDFYLNSFTIFNTGITNVTYNNACLNLLQCLEDLHRRKYGDNKSDKTQFDKNKTEVLQSIKDNAPLKKWANDKITFNKIYTFRERLAILIEEAKEVIVVLLESDKFYDDYPRIAKDFRNNLSHASINKTFQGEQFNLIFSLTKLLLTIHLLKTLEMENSSISYSLKNTSFIENLKWEIYPVYNTLNN